MNTIWVEKKTYRDSVTLMHLADQVEQVEGVTDVAVLMGTPSNKERLRSAGFDDPSLDQAGPEDICVGIEAENQQSMKMAVQKVKDFLAGKSREVSGMSGRYGTRPRTLSMAKKSLPDAQLVAISLPGEYAAREAERALQSDLHVFLFSDNVSIEAEKRLKQLARERGLMLMGPDCGTAFINGYPLGFCNEVPRGPVGLVAASGTGAQEVMSLLAMNGVGISHILGTGGRDLTVEVGGAAFEMGMDALENDDSTEVIVLISKPPAEEVEAYFLEKARSLTKPVVIHFIGHQNNKSNEMKIRIAQNLLHVASLAANLAGKRDRNSPLRYKDFVSENWEAMKKQAAGLSADQKYVRGLYSGGTLADEAALILANHFSEVHAGEGFGPVLPIEDWEHSSGHVILDMGEDRFTRGKPHPMISPNLRIDRLLVECEDPSVAVVLLDVVLGYNADPNPAQKLVPAILDARRSVEMAGRSLPVVVHICGTEGDPQNLKEQIRRFEEAGCLVFRSNVEAAYAAAWIAGEEKD